MKAIKEDSFIRSVGKEILESKVGEFVGVMLLVVLGFLFLPLIPLIVYIICKVTKECVFDIKNRVDLFIAHLAVTIASTIVGALYIWGYYQIYMQIWG